MKLRAKNSRTRFQFMLVLAREERGWSQTDLAKMAGFLPSAISHWECGRREPNLLNLCRLASHLGVSADYLLDREGAGAATPNKDTTHA